MIELTEDPNIDGNDYVVARNMAELLHRHYPGHLWGVTCQGDQGIATIRNMALSPTYGYVIRLSTLFGDSQMRCVIRAGGEILERFQQARGRVNFERIDSLPQLPTGFPIFDTAESKSKIPRVIKFARDKRLQAVLETGWPTNR